MSILVKLLQSKKAPIPIEVTELGIVILVNPELPIEVTELGIVILVNSSQ